MKEGQCRGIKPGPSVGTSTASGAITSTPQPPPSKAARARKPPCVFYSRERKTVVYTFSVRLHYNRFSLIDEACWPTCWNFGVDLVKAKIVRTSQSSLYVLYFFPTLLECHKITFHSCSALR